MSDESRDWRMNAYYYGFSHTGQDAIDRVLSAVACAGKSYHHTESWNDDNSPYPHLRGESCADWIQNAANDAATEFAALRAEVEQKEKALKQLGEFSVNLSKRHTEVLAEVERLTALNGRVMQYRADDEQQRSADARLGGNLRAVVAQPGDGWFLMWNPDTMSWTPLQSHTLDAALEAARKAVEKES